MRLLFLGDVMGRAGRDAISERLPGLIERLKLDFVIINGENASHGRGITQSHFEVLRDAGADVVTLGDHAFDQREAMTAVERHQTLIRPINLAPGAPGRGATLVTGRNGHQVLVVNALGRVFMPPMDDPFRALDAAIADCPLGAQADAIHRKGDARHHPLGGYKPPAGTRIMRHRLIPPADATRHSGRRP